MSSLEFKNYFFSFQVHSEQSELRKKDVLSAMSQLLEDELDLIQTYNDERSKTSKVLLENETKNNLLLNDVFQEYDKNRLQLVDKINQDEEWQKSAVATLIAKNDARSWGLMEQIKIVEAQIAAMTNYEIDKKKMNQDELLNDVAEKRTDLTTVLLDLMDQQVITICDNFLICFDSDFVLNNFLGKTKISIT